MHGAPRNRPGISSLCTDELPPMAWGPEDLAASRGSLAGRRPVDVLVVGAGILGAGIARDAAMRGLSVTVLEARDLAFGTSSRSTRLVHGGVRYLEQGDLGLVFEALRERAWLYDAVPHLVRRARFLFPAYRGDRLRPWRLRVGLTLYDALDLFRGTVHEFLPPDQCIAAEPLLGREGLLGAVRYEDAIADDARLTLAVLQDARRLGAEVITYVEVATLGRRDDLHVAHLTDGTEVPARQVVVAAGPWTQSRLMGAAATGLLTLSKGAHVVVDHARLPVRQPVVVQSPLDRRISFVVPWGPRTYLGTTDTRFEGDPACASAQPGDQAEILRQIAGVFPNVRLSPADIVSGWAGVRPLVRPTGGGRNTSDISRRHRIVENEHGVLCVVGGKLTTFRRIAEQVVDQALRRGGLSPGQTALSRAVARERPVLTGRPLDAFELGDPLVADLAPRHGPAARNLARLARSSARGTQRLVDGLPYRWCEVDACLNYEGVTHLIDVLRRRLPLVLTDVRRGASVAGAIARRIVDRRGGNDTDVQEELDHFREAVSIETGVAPPRPDGPTIELPDRSEQTGGPHDRSGHP